MVSGPFAVQTGVPAARQSSACEEPPPLPDVLNEPVDPPDEASTIATLRERCTIDTGLVPATNTSFCSVHQVHHASGSAGKSTPVAVLSTHASRSFSAAVNRF